MGTSRGRTVVAIAVCLLWLSGCESSTKLGDIFQPKPDAPEGVSAATTRTVVMASLAVLALDFVLTAMMFSI